MNKRKMNRLASAIAKAEGKKEQVSIGNIREVLGILVAFEWAAMFGPGKEKNAPSLFLAESAMAIDKRISRAASKTRALVDRANKKKAKKRK